MEYSEFGRLVNEVDALRISPFYFNPNQTQQGSYCYTNFDFVCILIYFYYEAPLCEIKLVVVLVYIIGIHTDMGSVGCKGSWTCGGSKNRTRGLCNQHIVTIIPFSLIVLSDMRKLIIFLR